MTQYGFYFNGPRCTGCKTCAMACKDKNDLPPEIGFRNVYEYTGGTWSNEGGLWKNDVFSYYVSLSCNHCASPVCMEVCPQGAISKSEETGAMSVDPEKCIHCESCLKACPYDVPRYDEAVDAMVRCDMCADLVAQGKQPVCVEACPLRALEFGDIEELKAKYGDVSAIAPMPEPTTAPSIVITAPVNGKPAGDTAGAVANERELS